MIVILRPALGNSSRANRDILPSHSVSRILTHLHSRSAMANRSFPAIDALTQQVQQSVGDEPDVLRLLGTVIKGLADEAVDPCARTHPSIHHPVG